MTGKLRWLLTAVALSVLLCYAIIRPHPVPRTVERGILRPSELVSAAGLPQYSQKPLTDESDGPGPLSDLRNDKFYVGGILSLDTHTGDRNPPTPMIYDPYPSYNSESWLGSWKGRFRPCLGPRGRDLDRTKAEDMMTAHKGMQIGFPVPMFGSNEAIGVDSTTCTDRNSRYSAYGYDEDNENGWPMVDWDQVKWGSLQAQCLERNADRYQPDASTTPAETPSFPARQTRSAVLVRSWTGMYWSANHRHYLRSLIMELSLHSGAEFEVFLMVHLDQGSMPSNPDAIQQLKTTHIPPEFHDITFFFDDRMLEKAYPKIKEHRTVFQHLQPLQLFSQEHPNFDYYWQFEMEARHTGHMYHFLSQAAEFARDQPRKYLWERNSYFYTPGVHGNWSEFRQMVNASMAGRESIWGPVTPAGMTPVGPQPPVDHPDQDDYEWGVGEEAEVITFLPIFDPRDTQWTFPNVIWNVPLSVPRRASPVAMWRLSKRVLDLMHQAQTDHGIGVVSEMSGPTWALWHGLKAVHVPHSIYADGTWSPHDLAPLYNRGVPEKINGGADSIWNFDHAWDHIMYRLSYMFTTQTAEDLFRRWLGYPINPDQYRDGSWHRDGQNRAWYEGGLLQEHIYGRLCFPPMFLNLIKNYEEKKGPENVVGVLG